MSDTFMTKRDIYYQNVLLFKNQVTVDQVVNDLCCTFNVSRYQLQIRACNKGLISGPIQLILKSGVVLDASQSVIKYAKPNKIQVITIQTSSRWILIVEKDAIFQSFISNAFHQTHPNTILITGKGYPDVATRSLIFKLSNELQREQPHLYQFKISALVDADPDGIEILSCYKFGSKSMAFQGDTLSCPRIKWIGIYPSQWILQGKSSMINQLIQLSTRDYKKVWNILSRSNIRNDSLLKNELCRMIHLGYKSEIQIIPIFKLIQFHLEI
ncbi:Spo11/DNA topoisomerase VI subunit A [Globomyces pollinis-pini]|nr:Spo11/DNA topoisomerase VI subunit A [Globomyces pollinis-pini]